MSVLIQREFVVDVPLERAWDHLARVEAWASWAKHIKSVTLEPTTEVCMYFAVTTTHSGARAFQPSYGPTRRNSETRTITSPPTPRTPSIMASWLRSQDS